MLFGARLKTQRLNLGGCPNSIFLFVPLRKPLRDSAVKRCLKAFTAEKEPRQAQRSLRMSREFQIRTLPKLELDHALAHHKFEIASNTHPLTKVVLTKWLTSLYDFRKTPLGISMSIRRASIVTPAARSPLRHSLKTET